MTESSGVPAVILTTSSRATIGPAPLQSCCIACSRTTEGEDDLVPKGERQSGTQAARHAGHTGTQTGKSLAAWVVVNELGPPTHVVHALHGQDPGWEEVKPLHENGKRASRSGLACTLATRRPELSLSQRQGTILCQCSKLYQVARPGPKAGQSFRRVAAAVDTYMHTSDLVVWEVHSLLTHWQPAQTDKRARAHAHTHRDDCTSLVERSNGLSRGPFMAYLEFRVFPEPVYLQLCYSLFCSVPQKKGRMGGGAPN